MNLMLIGRRTKVQRKYASALSNMVLFKRRGPSPYEKKRVAKLKDKIKGRLATEHGLTWPFKLSKKIRIRVKARRCRCYFGKPEKGCIAKGCFKRRAI